MYTHMYHVLCIMYYVLCIMYYVLCIIIITIIIIQTYIYIYMYMYILTYKSDQTTGQLLHVSCQTRQKRTNIPAAHPVIRRAGA